MTAATHGPTSAQLWIWHSFVAPTASNYANKSTVNLASYPVSISLPSGSGNETLNYMDIYEATVPINLGSCVYSSYHYASADCKLCINSLS